MNEDENITELRRSRRDPAVTATNGPDLGVEMLAEPLAADLGVPVDALIRAIRRGAVRGRRHSRQGWIASIASAERWMKARTP